MQSNLRVWRQMKTNPNQNEHFPPYVYRATSMHPRIPAVVLIAHDLKTLISLLIRLARKTYTH